MARRRSDRKRVAERLRLLEVLDRVLDRGIVCDVCVSISLSGIELVSIDAHVVVTSIETYLAHAEQPQTASQTPPLESTGDWASRQAPDTTEDSFAPEAVVRAVEQYLQQLQRGDQPG